MKKLVLTVSTFLVLSTGLSSAFAEITLSKSSTKSLIKDEFTGKLVEIIYCNKNGEAPCYQGSNERLIRANIKADSGSNIIVDFKDKDLPFGERLIPLIGKKIHAKFSPGSWDNFTYDVEYINVTE
jgi:hypothetical protein